MYKSRKIGIIKKILFALVFFLIISIILNISVNNFEPFKNWNSSFNESLRNIFISFKFNLFKNRIDQKYILDSENIANKTIPETIIENNNLVTTYPLLSVDYEIKSTNITNIESFKKPDIIYLNGLTISKRKNNHYQLAKKEYKLKVPNNNNDILTENMIDSLKAQIDKINFDFKLELENTKSRYETINHKIVDNIKKYISNKSNLPKEVNRQIEIVILEKENFLYLDELLKELIYMLELENSSKNNEFKNDIKFLKKQHNKLIKLNVNNNLNLNLYDFLYNEKEIFFETLNLLYENITYSSLFFNIEEYLKKNGYTVTATKQKLELVKNSDIYIINLNSGELIINYIILTDKNNNKVHKTPAGQMSEKNIIINSILTIISKNDIKEVKNSVFIIMLITLFFYAISFFMQFKNIIFRFLFIIFLPFFTSFLLAFLLFVLYNLLVDLSIFLIFFSIYLIFLIIQKRMFAI